MPDPVSGSNAEAKAAAAAILERHGIRKVSVDQYRIGGYRYSSLDDAVAEARRRERRGDGE